ncbi:MAG: competence/damage-inducible protein A [Clostridiales bacterium GWB2_37_7]|nr:MAG: competence/damage-inducible protein A [Clostridiales bacterium GWB2_37_7]
MKCEIIAVGTELLLGNIVNSNARYLSERLAELGIDVFYHTTVGDNMSRLQEVIQIALQRSDIIIATGGLGPTDDDITKEGVAEALGLKLVAHQESLDKIEDYFRKANRPMPDCNRKQGFIPEGSRVLENNNGTAPGILTEKNGKAVILLPGPPKEMTLMFEQLVYPYFKARSEHLIKSKTLRVVGVGESAIQERLQHIFDIQSNPTVAPYAKDGEVHLRITAKCHNDIEADNLLKDMEKQVQSILGENIYGYDEESLEYVVYQLLRSKKLTVSIAESCTGGLISSRLTNVSGVSEVLMNAIVTYSNQAKMKFLNVKEETLLKHGAVSAETAQEMALGIRIASNTDVGISVTGIAGPNGGTAEKPVGLFYIGLAIGDKVEAHRLCFPASREKVRWNAATSALDILRRELL